MDGQQHLLHLASGIHASLTWILEDWLKIVESLSRLFTQLSYQAGDKRKLIHRMKLVGQICQSLPGLWKGSILFGAAGLSQR